MMRTWRVGQALVASAGQSAGVIAVKKATKESVFLEMLITCLRLLPARTSIAESIELRRGCQSGSARAFRTPSLSIGCHAFSFGSGDFLCQNWLTVLTAPTCGAVILRYLFENFVLDTERRDLRGGDVAVAVEPQVFDLLVCLIENRQRVVSRDDLIARVWDGRI